MKKTSLKGIVLLLSIILQMQFVFAQNKNLSIHDWQQQIELNEQKVSAYVNSRLGGAIPSVVADLINNNEHFSDQSEEQKNLFVEQQLKAHYRNEFFKLNPNLANDYLITNVKSESFNFQNLAKGTAQSTSIECKHGDFENGMADITGNYFGFSSTYSSGECSFVPMTNVAYPSMPIPTTNRFTLTNNIPDPLIPALMQTNGGSNHALKINGEMPCTPSASIDKVSRVVIASTNGRMTINFSYALVMEDPNHSNQNPFFVARVLNSAGVEVGTRICRVSDLSNPFYQLEENLMIPGCNRISDVVWRDWTCAGIEFDAIKDEKYIVEFFMADCGAGGHFGYAYIDDICAKECCPSFLIQNCCDLQGGMTPAVYSNDPSVKRILADYKDKMDKKYGPTGGSDACCNPCKYPNDPFPIFIIGEDGSMISSVDYSIYWSHDGSTSAYSYILPGQSTTVTVTGPGNCKWEYTYQLDCCEDSINIVPFCPWDPCKYPNSQFPLKVEDASTGTILTSAAGYSFLWTYGSSTSTGDAITAAPTSFPVYVEVTYPDGCKYLDTFDINCCKQLDEPKNLKCEISNSGRNLYWDAVSGAAFYKVILTKDDPACCKSRVGTTYSYITTANTFHVPNTLASCFSWYVIAYCSDSTTASPESKKMCSCDIVLPRCPEPTDPKCSIGIVQVQGSNIYTFQRKLYWTPPTGILGASYELEFINSDIACCGTSVSMLPVSLMVTDPYYITPSLSSCFSWRVRTVCADGSKSPWVNGGCSCKNRVVLAKKSSGEDFEYPVGQLSERSVDVKLMPNPAKDVITFDISFDKNEDDNLTISIFDLTGKEVLNIPVNGLKVNANVSQLPSGTYIYALMSNQSLLFTDKIMINK